MNAPDRAAILDAFARQARACDELGSPFTGRVLRLLADDFVAGGPTAARLAGWTLPPVPSALALRLAGALHALVLAERAPALVRCWPPRETTDEEGLRAAVVAALETHPDAVDSFLARAVQTNEVQRSAVLLTGLAEIARRTGRALDVLEIGASGGLNLLCDRWRVRLPDGDAGPAHAAVVLDPEWRGAPPPDPAAVRIRRRAGVDLDPLDLRDPSQRLRARAFIWADQHVRMANFDAAVAALLASDVHVERGSADEWLPARLGTPVGDDEIRVVMHSIMWQYMPGAVRARTEAAIREAGAAGASTPLAWLRYEPDRRGGFELTLDLFAGRAAAPRERLAAVHPHGAWIDWQRGA